MDERFIQERGINVFTGCELLIKGGLEGGSELFTGYPGSPVADVFDVTQHISDILKEHGILAQIANNEALGAARLNGAQMADIRAMAFMKSVGAHVAADALAISNMAGAKGGAVVVIGDDPWNDSTQVPADSRFIARHLFLPILEPSTYQEMKDWVKIAFELSAESRLYIAYLVTTNQADGGGTVEVHPNIYPQINTKDRITLDPLQIPVDDRIVLPPDTSRAEVDVIQRRFPKLIEVSRKYQLNKILYIREQEIEDRKQIKERKRWEIGFVTSGLAYCYLEHALSELGLRGKIPILKLGVTYPLDPHIVIQFAQQVENIYVVEERRGFIESQIKEIITEHYQLGKIEYINVWGKKFPGERLGFPETRGLNPSIVIEKVATILLDLLALKAPSFDIDRERLNREIELIRRTASYQVDIIRRTPTFCPGCPHRDSGTVFEEIIKNFKDENYMKKHHHRAPVDLIFHGDIGCYSMFKYEPFTKLMHNLSGMGLGGGTGAGIDPFIDNKQVIFVGDSTFFHSGVAAISDSIKNNQDITYVILDNKTTAMTGHQPSPANDVDIMGNPTFAQDIEQVLRGYVGQYNLPIIRTNPEYRQAYKELLEDTILKDSVKFIIADKECGITYKRRVDRQKNQIIKKEGFLRQEKQINITPEVCEFCLECTKATGCPGLTITNTLYGPKIVTDLSTCVADTACTKIKACPSFEEVIIKRKRKPQQKVKAYDFGSEELPKPAPFEFKDSWETYTAGVGGMGLGVISAILVRAGMKQGYRVLFCDRKGLAIRNGGVYGYIIYSKGDEVLSPIIPYGKADLLLGLDILEAVRGLDPKGNFRVGSPEHTVAVINNAKTPTITALIGKDDFEPHELEKLIRSCTKEDEYFSANLFEVCERILGEKLYANIMMLGVAYQKGLLPIDLENLEWAIKMSVRADKYEKNKAAFDIGRRLVLYPERFNGFNIGETAQTYTYKSMLREKRDILSRSSKKGFQRSQAYQELVEEAVAAMNLNDLDNMHFALRVYDLIQYENLAYAKRYVERVKEVYKKDRVEYDYEATKSAIRYLHKVMLIKDEVYVAHLLTSEEKLKRDKERYNIDESNGDKMEYIHLNRPHFDIWGKKIEFDMNTKNWQLNIMKRMKFLRRLLPEWHRREKAFRDWYLFEVVGKFDHKTEAEYRRYLEALKTPEEVRGYREVRYPKMEEARKRVKELLGR